MHSTADLANYSTGLHCRSECFVGSLMSNKHRAQAKAILSVGQISTVC